MICIQYNDAIFRGLFPAFRSSIDYPIEVLQLYWNNATAYVSNVQGGCYFGNGFTLAQQTLAVNQMTAHLTALSAMIAEGQTPGIEISATIDKQSVTLQPPPETNQWQYWLQTTPYGQQLLALLQVTSAGGFYINSNLPARAGFC